MIYIFKFYMDIKLNLIYGFDYIFYFLNSEKLFIKFMVENRDYMQRKENIE